MDTSMELKRPPETQKERKKSQALWIIISLWILSVILLSVAPPQWIGKVVNLHQWDKLGHFMAYCGGGFLLYFSQKTHQWKSWLIFPIAILLSFSGEIIQLVNPLRSACDLGDLMSNLSGCSLGVLLPLCGLRAFKGKK